MSLPDQDPDPSLLEYATRRLTGDWAPVNARLESLEGWQRRLALWLLAVEAMALEYYRLDENIDGLQLLAFGLDQSVELPEASLLVSAYVLPEALDVVREEASPLEVQGELYAESVELRAEPWNLTLHAPINLRYGTLTCWVKPDAGGEGLLTVRHAVANGGRLQLNDGSVQRVLWYAPNCLDAAVATAPAGRSLRALPVAVPLAGDPVDLAAKRRVQQRTVLQVGATYGTTTAAIPHVFLLDHPLQSGDSGSLVRHSSTGDALGVYIGSLATASGARGFCQGLYQLNQLFSSEGKSSGFYLE